MATESETRDGAVRTAFDETALCRKSYAAVAKKVDEEWEEGEGRATTFWNDGQVFCVVEDGVGLSIYSAYPGGDVVRTVLWKSDLPIVREAIDRMLRTQGGDA